VAAFIITGGLTGASPAICPLPSATSLRPSAFSLPPSARRNSGTSALVHSGTPALRHPSTSQTASSTSREEIDAAIDQLGAFDADERAAAARVVRRAPGTVALPALIDAASGHADGYVRYRALVLLSGYDDPRVPDHMEQALGEVNERLRAVAFDYFARHPEPRLLPVFLKALGSEGGEFVRPALIRALTAQARDPKVRAALSKRLPPGHEVLSAQPLSGEADAGRALLDAGMAAAGPARAPVALAVAEAAVEQPSTLLALVELRQDLDQTLRLLREGFDLLDDDFAEEQFFVALRRAYHAEAEGTSRRSVIQAVINTLEF